MNSPSSDRHPTKRLRLVAARQVFGIEFQFAIALVERCSFGEIGPIAAALPSRDREDVPWGIWGTASVVGGCSWSQSRRGKLAETPRRTFGEVTQ